MAKIIEYLRVDGGILFTPDVSKKFVPLSPAGLTFLANGFNHSLFAKGDSFILLSYGVMLPENFTFWMGTSSPMPSISLFGNDIASGIPIPFSLPCFKYFNPALYASVLTEENKEHEIDGFCNYNDFKHGAVKVSGAFFLSCNFHDNINISMLNVPAAIDKEPQYAFPFVKVAHNFPLS